MKKLIILSGIPGSGKSTWAKINYPSALVCSTDHYMIDIYGNYKYDRSKLAEVHQKCYSKAKKAMMTGEEIVIVDNCNISKVARNTYKQLAKIYGYEVDLVVLKIDPQKAFQRCIHNVSYSAIKAMSAQLDSMADKKVIDNN